jgi:3-oxoacyl-[acyl-carrier-protein] synthase-3
MMTDSQGLLTAGVELARQTWAQAGLELGWTTEALDTVVMHQVSRAHTGKIVEALGLDLGRVVEIYPEFGNMGPASVPVALSKAVEQGRVGEGSRVGLMGIGSGLNCTMAEVVW